MSVRSKARWTSFDNHVLEEEIRLEYAGSSQFSYSIKTYNQWKEFIERVWEEIEPYISLSESEQRKEKWRQLDRLRNRTNLIGIELFFEKVRNLAMSDPLNADALMKWADDLDLINPRENEKENPNVSHMQLKLRFSEPS
tara:strand:+ start:19594 stop:20013 length:420 start_codon:yes stop_codon:yes gene_type:complete